MKDMKRKPWGEECLEEECDVLGIQGRETFRKAGGRPAITAKEISTINTEFHMEIWRFLSN